ncbi:DUF4838 domain-containing protein [Paenibacillus borealis]|uniref:Uncharacterized protein n=1 Tax=Paenibacillus borealis TaxID=160799 RepID=A0A089LI12_PAEBO|nr:DUF4838 domain-containing protein [Paenibacillus borealis]AIQ58793.1 hypothetical protein PBOR_19025 [Paenibacillus borealis]
MLSLIPEPKQVRIREEKPLQSGGAVGLRLTMEQDDPRLELHCRRAFPDQEFTGAVSGQGYSLIIEGIPPHAEPGETRQATGSAPAVEEADLFVLNGRTEGYLLEVGASGAVIRALDAPGLYYGLQTLLQLQSLYGDVPAVSITDWPDTALRVMNFDLRQTFSKPERLIEYLAEFSRCKTNAVLIEYEDKFPFLVHREFAHPQHALSREQLEALQAAAHEHYIEIIPLQQSFGHLEYVLRHEAWKHLRETEESTGEICPSRPETYELITGLLEEMMEAHPESRYIHLGCDEVYSLCECDVCKNQFGGVRERAFISFLNRLIEFTASRGRQPIFWHDMLDKCPPEELAKLDPRSAAMIWIYNGRNIEAEVTSLTNKFRALGIEVMGAPAVRSFDWAEHQNYPVLGNRTDNLLQWAETAEQLDIGCMVATNWTGPFSLGVPYGVFETTWYPMLLHADLAWNRKADSSAFIDRFLELFHGITPETGHARLGNYQLEDYYDVIWKLLDDVTKNKDYAELIAIMHEFEVATDRSRAIHKYAYRWELYPGDSAEWRSLLNNYTRNHSGREAVRPRMLASLLQYQPQDMAEHFVKSRFHLHDYLERTLYQELGLVHTEG